MAAASPGDQSVPLGDYSERCFRPLGLKGSIFNRLFDVQSDIQNSSIFRIFRNRPKMSDKSTFERPRWHFWSKMTTFGLLFGIDFSNFFENRKSVKKAKSITPNVVLSHQKPSIFASFFHRIFMFFPNPLSEAIFRRSKSELSLKRAILERSAI